MRKQIEKMSKVEKLIIDSMRHHGLLTPQMNVIDENDVKLPEHLKEPDFLFTTKTKEVELPQYRLAAFKSNKAKRGK